MVKFEDFCEHGISWNAEMVNRMNQRSKRIFRDEFDLTQGKRVLDLGARDGRWSWAALEQGASQVVGVEGRYDSSLLSGAKTALSPYVPNQFNMLIGDVFDIIPNLHKRGERFDTVMCLGFFYHIYDHYGLLRLLQRLEPKYIVIDSEMDNSEDSFVRVRKENVDHPNNAIPESAKQTHSAVGNISTGAMNLLADILGYKIHWSDWHSPYESLGCQDYVDKWRHTCILEKN